MTDRATEIRAEIASKKAWMASWEFQAHAMAVSDVFDAEAEWLGHIADLQDELNELEDTEATEEREAA